MRTDRSARLRRRGIGGFFLVFVVVLAGFGFVSSGRSVVRIIRLNRMKAQEQDRRDELRKERDRLRLEVYRLTSDSLTIERIAREEYGMVKKGEEVFNITPPDTTNGKKKNVDRRP